MKSPEVWPVVTFSLLGRGTFSGWGQASFFRFLAQVVSWRGSTLRREPDRRGPARLRHVRCAYPVQREKRRPPGCAWALAVHARNEFIDEMEIKELATRNKKI